MWKARRWLKRLFGHHKTRATQEKGCRRSAATIRPPPSATPEEWAAVTIQSHYRAYLSRRALRALKALVQLQALIRGCLARRRTAYVLQRFEALGRARARGRAPSSIHTTTSPAYLGCKTTPENVEHRRTMGLKKTWVHHRELEPWEHKPWTRSHSTLGAESWNPTKTPQRNKTRARAPSFGELETTSGFEVTPFNLDGNGLSRMLHSISSSRRQVWTTTPTRSDGTSHYMQGERPSYMAWTESSRAKVRAFSVPKHRSPSLFERSFSTKGYCDSPARGRDLDRAYFRPEF